LALEASLLNLSITCYPDHLEYVDEIFKFCGDILTSKKDQITGNPACIKQLMKLLSIPLETFQNILTVLKLEMYPRLITFLAFDNRKRVAMDITKTAVEFTPAIPQADQVNKLLELIAPLVKDETAETATPQTDQEDFEEEQTTVASLVHLFDSEDVEQLFLMYVTARKHFGQGGPKRIKYTLVPLVFRVLKLTLRIKSMEAQDADWGQKAKKVFKFAHETVTALARTNLPDLSLRLFIQCAHAANKCGPNFETIAYEFITQAFVIYEEQVSADSQAQYNALNLMIGSLPMMTAFSDENYDTLVTKTALYSSKLLKKPDQCRAIYMCSHLFWVPERNYNNGKRVLECLQKSLKIADTCMDSAMNVHLFVEILNQYLYYFENGCDAVTSEYLSGLIALINTNIANMDAAHEVTHYKNTLEFIKTKKESDPRYKAISLQ